MSLLYALFSTTMSKIKSESQALWLFRRYQIICKFEKSPSLPPPLSPLCYLYDCFSSWIWKSRCNSGCCGRKGAGCCRAPCCGCCGESDLGKKGSDGGGLHEAFFWTQTRQAYLALKTDKDRKKGEREKVLNDMSVSLSDNVLLAKTTTLKTDHSRLNEMLTEALKSQRTVGRLEADLSMKESENERLMEHVKQLKDEISRLELAQSTQAPLKDR